MEAMPALPAWPSASARVRLRRLPGTRASGCGVNDFEDMYREVILDHYKNPRNYGAIEEPHAHAEGQNPLCGDEVAISVRFAEDGETIEDVRFEGRGCAISQASASLLTERLKGIPLDDAKRINKDDVLGELGIESSRARIKCALLPLKVLKVGAYGLAGEDEE